MSVAAGTQKNGVHFDLGQRTWHKACTTLNQHSAFGVRNDEGVGLAKLPGGVRRGECERRGNRARDRAVSRQRGMLGRIKGDFKGADRIDRLGFNDA